MGDEAQDMVKVGIELIVGAVFLFLVVSLMITAGRWHGREEYIRSETQYRTEESPNMTFENIQRNGKTVSGNDIINFIVRNTSKYEYVIGTGKPDNSPDATKAVTDMNLDAIGTDRDNRDTLRHYSFSSHDILKKNNIDRPEEQYTDKKDEAVSSYTGVRVYGTDLINRRHSKTTDIYSEKYLLITAGLEDHLEDRFHIYVDRNNGEIIRWYFLMDPQAADDEAKGR